MDPDLGPPPESWEVADLDASVRRLMLSSSKKDPLEHSSSSSPWNSSIDVGNKNQRDFGDCVVSPSDTSSVSRSSSGGVSEDLIKTVDQFLLEALQNPRERVSVLRIEQDIANFMRDPSRQQMEFQELPTSYLRLAAHRIARHYSLSSMVSLDNDLPDGSSFRIIVQKTSNCRMPLIRLADIPVNLPSEDSSVKKVAIKQRPQRGSQGFSSSNSHLSKSNSLKSVEERKEEYNKARARIFNSNSSAGVTAGKAESERRAEEMLQHHSRAPRLEGKYTPGGAPECNVVNGGLVEGATGISRAARARMEKERVGGSKISNKVAILRDHETDRKDPDYDRSHDRYMQRFDPGFGFNAGAYGIQPLYAPAVDYNTEFPQLGQAHRSSISTENHPRPLAHHQPGGWSTPSSPRIVYGPPETMVTTFSATPLGAQSNSGPYFASQYPSQHTGVTYMPQHEHLYQYFTQSNQQQHDATFQLARPR